MVGNEFYTNIRDSKRVREEHSLKYEHSESFSMSYLEMSEWYDSIFSTTVINDKWFESNIWGGIKSTDELLESIALSFNLLKTYVINGLSLLKTEANKRGLPKEHVEDIGRELFLLIADADNEKEVQAVTTLAMKEYNRRFRLYMCGKYTYPVRSAVEVINKKRFLNISAGDIAEEIGYERTYLAKCFKQEVEMTMTEYISKVKMETAADLICTHTYTLGEIAELLSFSGYSQFAVKFEKYFGIKPKYYERSISQIKNNDDI